MARKPTDWTIKTGFKWSKRLSKQGLFPQLDSRMNGLVGEQLRAMMPAVYQQLVRRLRSGWRAKHSALTRIDPYSKAYSRLLRRAGLSDQPDLTLRKGLLDHLAARVKMDGGAVVAGLYPYGASDGGSRQWLYTRIRQREGTYVQPGRMIRAGYEYSRRGKIIKVPPKEIPDRGTTGITKPVTYQSLANELSGRYGMGRWTGRGKSDQGERAPGRFLTLTAAEMSHIEAMLARKAVPMVEAVAKAGLIIQ